VRILNYAELIDDEGWKLSISVGDNTYDCNSDVIKGSTGNIEAAWKIHDYLYSEVEEYMTHNVDIVVVPDMGGIVDGVIVYFRSRLKVVLDGYTEAHINYLMDGEGVADIYHLCRNISYNYGACKETGKFPKRSNVYCEKKEEEGKTIWSNSGFPILMNNCKLCEYCITFCPRKAIRNKIDHSSKTITQLGTGDLTPGDFKEQYYRCAQAKDGSEIYE